MKNFSFWTITASLFQKYHLSSYINHVLDFGNVSVNDTYDCPPTAFIQLKETEWDNHKKGTWIVVYCRLSMVAREVYIWT